MTVTHRKRQHQPEEIQSEFCYLWWKREKDVLSPTHMLSFSRSAYVKLVPVAVNEPGLQILCDGCDCDLTHSIRMKCADPACEEGDGVDICPPCFCAGKEFRKHKKNHAYRVVVCPRGLWYTCKDTYKNRRSFTHIRYLLKTGGLTSKHLHP